MKSKIKKCPQMDKNVHLEPVPNGHHGITLIALVITIIVLLILAGVSIATLTGENGVLTQADRAKEATEQAEKEEKIQLQKAAESIGEVTQISDQTPGELSGEGTEENPFSIQSIEDLVVFAYEVRNGRTFENEYVELTQSLDFQSDKSYVNPEREDYGEYGYNGKLKEVLNDTGFISIGIVEHSSTEERKQKNFAGNFNGNGYKIYHIRMEKEITTENYIALGLFATNYGEIQNLGIESGIVDVNTSTPRYTNVGMLTGINYGTVKNCYSSGEVKSEISPYRNNTTNAAGGNTGGLIGSNAGIIKECYNKANVDAINKGNYGFRVGGLAAVNESIYSVSNFQNSLIENSYNGGNVYVQTKEDEKSESMYIGGIVGLNYGDVKNTYNIGQISCQDENALKISIGSNVGKNYSSIDITNLYYLENTILSSDESLDISTIGEVKTSQQLKESTFAEILDRGNDTQKWKIDSNKNEGYPILYWQ